MRKKLKTIAVGALAITLLAGTLHAVPAAAAGDSRESSMAEEVTVGKLVVPEEEVYATVNSVIAGPNGVVDGNGVRLRKKPKSTAQILELMYNGEYVCIFGYETYNSWFLVQRTKTGTIGYVSKKYIYEID